MHSMGSQVEVHAEKQMTFIHLPLFSSIFADRKLFKAISADHWDVLCLECVVVLYRSANFHISIPLDNRKIH